MLALAILLEYRAGTNEGAVLSPNPLVPNQAARVARRIPQPAGPSGLSPSGSSRSGAIPSAASLEDWVRTILERPLFSPSRRPGQVAVAATELPRLAGIIIGPGGARAIFATGGDSRAIVAGAGAHAGPYLIRAVGPTGVSVVGPNGPELLRPSYDRNASREANAPGNQAPGLQNPGNPGASILDLLRARVQNGVAPPPALPAPSPPQRFQK